MFSDTELALMNRANLAERETDRIIGQYRGMIRELKEAIHEWESTARELNDKIRGWISYSQKLEKRLENTRAYLRTTGLDESQIEKIIRG